MNKRFKSLSIMLICAALSLTAFLSCSKKNENRSSGIVARIGEETVSEALYRAAFDSYAEYWKQLGQDPFSSEKELEDFQNLVLDALVSDITVLHHARQEGITLDETELAEVKKTAEEETSSIKNDYMLLAGEAHQKDASLTVEEHFDRLIGELAEYYTGKIMSFDEYKKEYENELVNSALIEKFKEKVCSEFKVTEDDIMAWYNEHVEQDEKHYLDHPESFGSDMIYFENFFGKEGDALPISYVPDGYSRILDITVSPESEPNAEYAEKLQQLNSIAEECSALLFSDALNETDSNASKIEELIKDYKALEKETNSIYDEYTRSAKEKIDAAYEELKNGADFETVAKKYSTEQNSLKRTVISLQYDMQNDWSKTVKDIYAMTEAGSFSSVFTDADGSMHIIYHGEDLKSGRVTLESMHDDIAVAVRGEKRETEWKKLIDEWSKDKELFIDHEMIKTIGREKLSDKK